MTSSPQLQRTRADYTVACICPMGVELAPVEAMLDEIHDARSFSRGQNAYTLGKIGEHYVVVAVMPEIGLSPAAAVATQLLNDFPAIRFALLVGVGGGIPGDVDIRLGDVVVGQPTDAFGGVVQYDLGKRLKGGQFQKTGQLNKPPAVLSAHVRQLNGQHRRRGNQLLALLSEMMTKYPRMRTDYSFPGVADDNLFLASYTHQTGTTCDHCDREQIIRRAPRLNNEPHVHYGTIGSANMVVKDAVTRDELTREMNVLCVEMEAAGLMGSFPCLVIRGICDYADSHKNKQWQPYAAAVAAAYMKELLLIIPTHHIDTTESAFAATQLLSRTVVQEAHLLDSSARPNDNISDGQHFHYQSMNSIQHMNPVLNQREESGFVQPVGVCLGQAPMIETRLFVGRDEEISRMTEILKPGDSSTEQRRCVLGGMGGIGKTQLALAYVSRHRDLYDSIFWLNASSKATLKADLHKMAERIFGVQGYRALQDEQISVHLKRWLSDTQNRQWLLIFDNHDEPASYDITAYYPYTTQGSIIITTRLPHQVSGEHVPIRALQDVEHSLQVLATRSLRQNIRDDSHAYRLAEKMAGLPLALATVGAYLQKSTWSCQQYLEEYERRWNVSPLRPVRLYEYQDRTLYTTWDLSYQRLMLEDPPAAQLLKLLAYFDHQGVWYELLHAGVNDAMPEQFTEIANEATGFDGLMRVLIEYCFVEISPITNAYSIHTCVHDWTLAGLNISIDPKSYWYAFDCIAMSIDGVLPEVLGHVRYARLAPHAVRLANDTFVECGRYISTNRTRSAKQIAHLLRNQLQPVAAETILNRLLAVHEKELGPEHGSTISVIVNLGRLYMNDDRLDRAEQMFQRALSMQESKHGPDHISTAPIINNLGAVYARQHRLDEAEQMYKRALAEREKASEKEHPLIYTIAGNLGKMYHEQGRQDEAEELYKRALAGREKVLEPGHVKTLGSTYDLANLYAKQKKLDQAEEMYKRALAGYEKALGSEHRKTLRTVYGLGLLHLQHDRLDEAETMLKRALAGYQKTRGPTYKSTLDAAINLEALYSRRYQSSGRRERLLQAPTNQENIASGSIESNSEIDELERAKDNSTKIGESERAKDNSTVRELRVISTSDKPSSKRWHWRRLIRSRNP